MECTGAMVAVIASLATAPSKDGWLWDAGGQQGNIGQPVLLQNRQPSLLVTQPSCVTQLLSPRCALLRPGACSGGGGWRRKGRGVQLFDRQNMYPKREVTHVAGLRG